MKMKHTTKALACTSIAKYFHKWKGPYNPYIYITLKFQKKFVAFHHFLLRICAKKCCDCKPSWPRPFFPLVVKCDLFQQLYHTLKITTMSISYPKTLPHIRNHYNVNIFFNLVNRFNHINISHHLKHEPNTLCKTKHIVTNIQKWKDKVSCEPLPTSCLLTIAKWRQNITTMKFI
jgi:hypothetical protein